jgi:hypothetical protein
LIFLILGESKIAVLCAVQLKLLRGEIATDPMQSTSRQIIHDDAPPGAVHRSSRIPRRYLLIRITGRHSS